MKEEYFQDFSNELKIIYESEFYEPFGTHHVKSDMHYEIVGENITGEMLKKIVQQYKKDHPEEFI